MKRPLTIIMLLLMGGAIINIAVAWWCVLGLPPYMSGNARPMSDEEVADRLEDAAMEIPREWMEGTYATVQSRFGWTSWGVSTGDADATVFVDVDRTDAGWPVHGLTGYQVYDSRQAINHVSVSHGAISVFEWFKPKRTGQPVLSVYPAYAPVEFVPYRPTWPGFAINTIFYAAMLWILFFAPFAMRRRIRRRIRLKRGRCVKCAYPIGTSSICTECGAAVKPRAETVPS